jgi:toxin FitB
MAKSNYLIDTNILIYHVAGSQVITRFMRRAIMSLNISIITKIEFLGWPRHTPEGFEMCRRLLETANLYPVDERVADKAVELKRTSKLKLGDAVIAATAILNGFTLATRNIHDFKAIREVKLFNPFR